MNESRLTESDWDPVRYCAETDTMAIEIRPWPGRDSDDAVGRDAGEDLVIHDGPDGRPWLWEIEHASKHPEHIAAGLAELRRQLNDQDPFALAGDSTDSSTYELFRQAMAEKKQVVCKYAGYRRELCPIILGHSKGEEKALTYQFGGGSRSGLPDGGEWRCIWLAKVHQAQLREGPWHSGSRHTRPQGCVEIVDLDVNPLSPYEPRGQL